MAERDSSFQPAESVEAAWTAAIAGAPDTAAISRRAVEAIKAAAAWSPRAPVGKPVRRHVSVDGGRRIVISSPRQLAILDARNLAPLAMIVASECDAEPLPGSLFLAHSSVGHSFVYDARALAVVTDFGHAPVAASPDGAALLTFEAPRTLRVWSVETRQDEWRTTFQIPAGYPAPEEATFADRGRVVVLRAASHAPLMTFDAKTARPLVVPAYGTDDPAFSQDGKLVAHVSLDEQGTKVMTLVDRATAKTIATSKSCAQPGAIAFDPAGRFVAVEGTNSVCLLEVPSLRVRGQLSLGAGARGDQQVVKPTVERSASAVDLETQARRELPFCILDGWLLPATHCE